MNLNEDIKSFMDRVKKIEKGHQLDLSSGEDLSMAIMNLISLEEHLFFTAQKTNHDHYLDLLNEIRQMRVALLKKIIKDYEGEVWCMSKHLLATSMRLMEVGTKDLTKGNKKEAQEMFTKAYQLYSLFWGLNLGLVKTDQVKTSKAKTASFIDESDIPQEKAKVSLLSKLGQFVQKAIDCCKE